MINKLVLLWVSFRIFYSENCLHIGENLVKRKNRTSLFNIHNRGSPISESAERIKNYQHKRSGRISIKNDQEFKVTIKVI